MGLFGQAKDLYSLQKKAKQIKKDLKKLQIEAEIDGIKVILSAEQEVLDIQIEPENALLKDPKALAESLKKAINQGVKRSQEVAAEKMRGMMGDLGMDLPGIES